MRSDRAFRPWAETRDTEPSTTREVAKSPILPEGFSLYGEAAHSAGGVPATDPSAPAGYLPCQGRLKYAPTKKPPLQGEVAQSAGGVPATDPSAPAGHLPCQGRLKCAPTKASPIGVPAEAQRSGFGGERRRCAVTKLFALGRKRGIRSHRRRGRWVGLCRPGGVLAMHRFLLR